ncbi:MAG: hypothetical protein EOR00_09150 [Mesorhizobium sp.]|uniref:hypothetical protein n=1 Tax=Mesorhizobium sp. TaxID=1871066 RepID=UPI000FE9A91A|nr:hypothetical protein [Mesorhizobium sp.]RWP19264.1 MAG: hypothetical protein EOR00_09150 [Mesorhizobium sp.]
MYKALIGSACAAVILVSGVHLYDRHMANEAAEAASEVAFCAHAKERMASIDATDEDRNGFFICGLRDVIAAGKAVSFEPVVQSAQEISTASDLKDAW